MKRLRFVSDRIFQALLWMVLFTYLTLVRNQTISVSDWLVRKLVGSNCIQIQRGKFPEYYYCYDCTIEDAIACVTSMRKNISKNVGHDCNMAGLMDGYQSNQCCPKFNSYHGGKVNLQRIGSAYPEALRCISSAGCSSTTVYTQLLAECESVCYSPTYVDIRDNGPICFADFNSSYRISDKISSLSIIVVFLLSYYFLLFIND